MQVASRKKLCFLYSFGFRGFGEWMLPFLLYRNIDNQTKTKWHWLWIIYDTAFSKVLEFSKCFESFITFDSFESIDSFETKSKQRKFWKKPKQNKRNLFFYCSNCFYLCETLICMFLHSNYKEKFKKRNETKQRKFETCVIFGKFRTFADILCFFFFEHLLFFLWTTFKEW